MILLLSMGWSAFADCPADDSFEDNDSYAQAALFPGPSFNGLWVCDTDEDWFQIQGTELACKTTKYLAHLSSFCLWHF